jgi:cell division protein FtsL
VRRSHLIVLFSLLVIPFGLIQDSTLAFWLMTVIVASAMGVVTVVSVQLIVYIQYDGHQPKCQR